jgi:biopolymer transport protein ExbD
MHNNTVHLFSRYNRPRRLISLTPLIDVVFILLLFFMSVSNYQKWHRLPLDSAQSGQSQKQSSSDAKIMLIRLNVDSLKIDGILMNTMDFNQHIKEKINSSPNLKILLQPAGDIVLQRMVNIIDQINAAGGSNISIVDE